MFVTYANADAQKGQLTWRPSDSRVSTNELDQWILSDLQELLKTIQVEMEAYRLYNMVPAVLSFMDDLTNWYIRRSRRRFWKSENDGDKNDAYATLYQVLIDFSKVLAPILPFLAEEIYQILVREVDATQPVSVHLCAFPLPKEQWTRPQLVEKMNGAREAVNLGRSLRAQYNLKNRLPLASIRIAVRTEEQRESLLSLKGLIQEELNVKEVQVSLDESSLVTLCAKANFKTLGKRMGKTMKTVAEAIGEWDHEKVQSLLSGNNITLPEGEISAQDIIVVREVPRGLVVEASTNMTVALDTVVTEDLLKEGLARECVNRIQNLRKGQGLDVTDKISIQAHTSSDLFIRILEEHQNYIQSEVLGKEIQILSQPLEAEKTKATVEYEGQQVVFVVQAE